MLTKHYNICTGKATVAFDREVYFDKVRASLFGGHMSQGQVDGQNAIISVWETLPRLFPTITIDRRWLAYMLSTTYHETSQEMLPIEEYGRGEGRPYGEVDPETEQVYYGRGDVQLTWRENYQKATDELGLVGDDDLVWDADKALDPVIAAKVMYLGMYQGWFRSDSQGAQTLLRYFNDTTDDPYNAREIINGDKKTIPSWSNGVSIGNLIKDYYEKFREALTDSWYDDPEPEQETASIQVNVSRGVKFAIIVNGELWGPTDYKQHGT